MTKALVEKLSENPPHALHEGQVHGLIVVAEIDPTPAPCDDLLPLLHVARHDAPALLVVTADPHLEHLVSHRSRSPRGARDSPTRTGA